MKLFVKTFFLTLVTSLFLISFASALDVIKATEVRSDLGSGSVSCQSGWASPSYTFVYNNTDGRYVYTHCFQKAAFTAGGIYVVNTFIEEPLLGICSNGTSIAGNQFKDKNGKNLALCVETASVEDYTKQRVVESALFKDGICDSGYELRGEFNTSDDKHIRYCVKYQTPVSQTIASGCTLTNLRWLNEEKTGTTNSITGWESNPGKVHGEKVFLVADASAECKDLYISFEISSTSHTTFQRVYLKGNYFEDTAGKGVGVEWPQPPWIAKSGFFVGDANEPVKYKFTPLVSGYRKSDSSPELTVSRPGEVACYDNDDCDEGKTCTADGRCIEECEINPDCEELYGGAKDYCLLPGGVCVECLLPDETYGHCAEEETCNEDNICFNPQTECKLESAVWMKMNSEGEFSTLLSGTVRGWISPQDLNANRYQDGEQLAMLVELVGPRECRDSIRFTVYEDDPLFPDFVETIQGNRHIAHKMFRPLWSSAFLGIWEGSLEYQFTAELLNSEGEVTDTEPSNVITVSKPELKECTEATEEEECKDNEICSEGGACVPQCEADNDCQGGQVCSSNKTCVGCTENADCTGNVNVVCSTENECVQCNVDADCVDAGLNYVCSENACVDSGDPTCEIESLFWIDPETDTEVVDLHGGGITGSKEGFKVTTAVGQVVLIAQVEDMVEGEQNGCEGKTVHFRIREEKTYGDRTIESDIETDEIEEDTDSVSYLWEEAKWKDSASNPQYYFRAWIDGYEDIKEDSQTITVLEPECSSNDDCVEDYSCKEKDCVKDESDSESGICDGSNWLSGCLLGFITGCQCSL